jgi:hypothetical protein
MVAAVAAGGVLSLGLGLAMRMDNFVLGVPLAVLAGWAAFGRKLGAPALIGLGALAGFFFVR